MSDRGVPKTMRSESPAPTPASSNLLQRKCDCGQHTIAGRECSSCSKEREMPLQRSGVNRAGSNAGGAPSITHEVLNSPGKPIDAASRDVFEPRFSNDFSQVPARAKQYEAIGTKSDRSGSVWSSERKFQLESLQLKKEAKVGQGPLEDEDKKIEEKIEAAPNTLPPVSTNGRPLADAVRREMERAFQTDFSDVRVHEGAEAGRINALAFTHGSDIHFAAGRYEPSSRSGRQLLGHELTHVLQQRAGLRSGAQASAGAIVQDSNLELEADVLGVRAARGELVNVSGTTSSAQGKHGGNSGQVVQRATIAWNTVGYASDAGNDSSSTTEKNFVTTYKATEDKTKTLWNLQVDSVTGGADIEMHTDAWRNAFTTPPTTEAEAKDAVTDMKGYYNRGAAGSWHTEDASRTHEEHHYKEWKCSAEHYWPKTEAAIEKLTVSKATYPAQADAITALKAGASGADNKMQAFKDKARDYWFTLSDAAKSRPYAAGQKVLNKAIEHVQALAVTKKWTVPKGTESPSDATPCYKGWLGYSP